MGLLNRIEGQNFIQLRTEEEVNQVDMDKYTLVRVDEKGLYHFKIRESARKER